MSSCIEKARIADEETYGMENLPKVPVGERPTQATTIDARQTIEKILMGISNTIANTGLCGYTSIIYTPVQWIALGIAQQVVSPTNIGIYVVAIKQDNMPIKHRRQHTRPINVTRTQLFVIHIFGEVIFLNLQNVHQNLVGHTPLELLEYLETTYVTDTQKRDDITAMDAKMRQPFSMDMMIKSYLMDMTSAWFTLASLCTTIDDAEMICL